MPKIISRIFPFVSTNSLIKINYLLARNNPIASSTSDFKKKNRILRIASILGGKKEVKISFNKGREQKLKNFSRPSNRGNGKRRKKTKIGCYLRKPSIFIDKNRNPYFLFFSAENNSLY